MTLVPRFVDEKIGDDEKSGDAEVENKDENAADGDENK